MNRLAKTCDLLEFCLRIVSFPRSGVEIIRIATVFLRLK